MSSCTSCSTAAQTYQSAQSYIKQQLNAASKPEQQNNVEPAGPEGLNSSGRGQLLNVKA
jgi:hypothetical protein